MIEFEWDSNKEKSNLAKHGISFISAARLLNVEHYVARSDRHSEVRYLAVGEIEGCVLAVVYTKRFENYRIISARRASNHEEKTFQKYREISRARFASRYKDQLEKS